MTRRPDDGIVVVMDHDPVEGHDEAAGTFEVDAETEAALLESIVEGRRGQTTPIASLLTDLRSRE